MSFFEQIRSLAATQDAAKNVELEDQAKSLWETQIKPAITAAVMKRDRSVHISFHEASQATRAACYDYIIRHAGWPSANISWSSWACYEKPSTAYYNCLLSLKW